MADLGALAFSHDDLKGFADQARLQRVPVAGTVAADNSGFGSTWMTVPVFFKLPAIAASSASHNGWPSDTGVVAGTGRLNSTWRYEPDLRTRCDVNVASGGKVLRRAASMAVSSSSGSAASISKTARARLAGRRF